MNTEKSIRTKKTRGEQGVVYKKKELPEYIKTYDAEADGLVQEIKNASEISGEEFDGLLEERSEGAKEVATEAFEQGDAQLAEALSQESLSKEDVLAMKEAFAAIVDKAEITTADSYASRVTKFIEAHYGTKKETIYKAFKGLGAQGLFFGLGEAAYSGYQALRAESSEERGEHLQNSWRSACEATGVLVIPEALYRTAEYLRGDEEEKERQKAEMKKSLKKISVVWRWVLGDSKEKAEVMDQGKASAIMIADAFTFGSAAMYGLTKEVFKMGKDAYMASSLFEESFDGLGSRLDKGEKVTVWDVSSELISAGMEASGKEPDEVLQLVSETLQDEKFIKHLPERQKKTMDFLSQVLQTEEGRKHILQRIAQFDALVTTKKR